MPASIGSLAIDTVDPDQIAPSWCALLGVEAESALGGWRLYRNASVS
jgi:hypothetical protein